MAHQGYDNARQRRNDIGMFLAAANHMKPPHAFTS